MAAVCLLPTRSQRLQQCRQPLRPLARPTPSGTASRAGPPDRPGIQQRWLQRGLVPLPGGDQDRQRPPTALNAQVQLAAQPAAAAPQGLILRRSTSPLRFEVAWDHIQASIEGGLESCTRPLAYALPQCTPEEIHRLDRSVPRTFFSALLDRTVTQEELRHELLSLIQGWPATVGKQAPAKHLKVITDAGT